jgi:hypothetical protein
MLDVNNYEEPRFDSGKRQRFFSFPSDENGSVFHPDSCTVGRRFIIRRYKTAAA